VRCNGPICANVSPRDREVKGTIRNEAEAWVTRVYGICDPKDIGTRTASLTRAY
jgi:hypothetical protein